MKKYGYIRVSSKDQNIIRQLEALREEKIEEKYIYIDKISGKDFNRPQYKKLMKKLKKEDLLVIKSIDRLGRNYSEILEEWKRITCEIGADIQVIDMPLLNTKGEHDNLTSVLISDLVLQILAYVAETERSFIKQRQAEGIKAAKERGVHFGKKKIELSSSFEEYYQKWSKKEVSGRQAAKDLQISTATFYRRCKEYKEMAER